MPPPLPLLGVLDQPGIIRTVILILFGGAILLLALRSLRAQRLKERYALLFLVVGTPFLIVALWPDGVLWVSQTLRIEKATVMILALAIFSILILLQLFSIVSVQDRKIAALAQVIGLLTEKQNMTGRQVRNLTEQLTQREVIPPANGEEREMSATPAAREARFDEPPRA